MCPICMEEEILIPDMSINDQNGEDSDERAITGAKVLKDKNTFEFTANCKHRTCVKCAVRIFKDRVRTSKGIME